MSGRCGTSGTSGTSRKTRKSRTPRSSRTTGALVAILLFVLGALFWSPVRRWSAAVRVLTSLSAGPTDAGAEVRIRDIWLPGAPPVRRVRARIYEPSVVYRCIVVGHGVHHRGIDEPRLVRFARALSSVGARVLTPELSDLADYRITRAGVDVLGESVRFLSSKCPSKTTGLLGFSFAGGQALMAAMDEATFGHLAYVASVGGYHDLGRVSRFLLSGTVEAPDGSHRRTAHEYGIVVLLQGHLDRFVPEADLAVARGAFRAWLHEDRDAAWAIASARTKAETEQLFLRLAGGRIHEVAGELGRILAEQAAEVELLSPHGRLSEIAVPVYLLHGSGDNVIPPEETLWARRELGGRPQATLITPLIEHAEMKDEAGLPGMMTRLLDEMGLVRFMAQLL